MRQQINLYQPIFRSERKQLSARTAALGLVIVAISLGALYAYGAWQIARLEQQVQAVRTEQTRQQRLAEEEGKLRGTRAPPTDILARVAALDARLTEHRQAGELLRAGAAGHTKGFAARLEALAHQHVDGLWLDLVLLSGTSPDLTIGGGTTAPSLVPRYLKALTQEAALAGTRFQSFMIEQPDSADAQAPNAMAGLRFHASSALPAQPEESANAAPRQR
jgi:hypothetical protein